MKYRFVRYRFVRYWFRFVSRPWLDTDIPSKYFVCLQDVFKTSSRHVFKTFSRYVFKTSSRRLQRNNFLSSKTSSRRLQDVLEEEKLLRWRRVEDGNYRPDLLLPLVPKVTEISIHYQLQDYQTILGRLACSVNVNHVFSTHSCLAPTKGFFFNRQGSGDSYQHDFDWPWEGVWHTEPRNTFWKDDMIGFKTPVAKWFESCLSNRKFFVSLDNVFSETGILNFDILQGSILGPLLFEIYIDDLSQSLSKKWLLSLCWWDLYFPSRRRRLQNWRCSK